MTGQKNVSTHITWNIQNIRVSIVWSLKIGVLGSVVIEKNSDRQLHCFAL